MNIGAYFLPSDPKDEKATDVSKYDQQLRFLLGVGYLSAKAKQVPDFLSDNPDLKEPLESLYRELEEETDPSTHDIAARVVVGDLIQQKPAKADISKLALSKFRDLRAIATIYSEEQLDRNRATVLASRLEDDSIVSALARVKAYRLAGDKTAHVREMPVERWSSFGGVLVFLAVGLFLGVFNIVRYFIAISMGATKPGGAPAAPMDYMEADGTAMRVFTAIIALFVLSLFIGVIPAQNEMVSGAFVSVLFVVATIYAAGMAVYGKTLGLARVFGRSKPLFALIYNSLRWYFINVTVFIGLAMISSLLAGFLPEAQHPIVDSIRESRSLADVLALFLQACVCAPIAEEIIFRGMLFPAIAKVTRSVPLGMVLSSLVFASIHPQGLAGILPLWGIGMVLCMATHHYRSLLPAMIVHALHNSGQLYMNMLL